MPIRARKFRWCLLALEGAVELTSRRRRRRVAARDFFTGMMTTERADDELIEAVFVPNKRPDPAAPFAKSARRHGDFAIVACAAVCDARAYPPSRRRRRRPAGGAGFPGLEGDALDDALDAFAWELDARDDVHATARYRRDLVRRIGAATIREAQQMPRLSAGRRQLCSFTLNGQPSTARPSRGCCSPIFCATARADRNPCRLRAWRVRRLHHRGRRRRRRAPA